jgi:hypothetical protein
LAGDIRCQSAGQQRQHCYGLAPYDGSDVDGPHGGIHGGHGHDLMSRVPAQAKAKAKIKIELLISTVFELDA